MKKLIACIIAIGLMMAEVDSPGGLLTWVGGGIILISVLDFLKKVYYEQENN
jgi:membrane protein implicated in regulation of membrane protease activity